MKNALMRRFLPMLLVSLLCVTMLAPAAGAVTQKEINDLKAQASSLKQQKSEIKKQLSRLSDSADEAMKKKKALDKQCAVLQEQIDVANRQIDQYTVLVSEKEAAIAENEEKEAEQYELFCKRVRAMEENGTISYWECIFKATSFTNLLSRLDFVYEIMEGDRRVMQELQDLRNQLKTEKTELEEARRAQVEVKNDLKTQQSELEANRREAAALVKKIDEESDQYESTLNALEKEENDIQADIVKKSQQLAAQNKPSGGGSANTGVHTSWMGSGGYMWPEKASKRITSPYGVRTHPITHKKKMHNGVDIGGVGYNTEVLAAKAGTVIVSQYSNSYGNYVVVSHGAGNTTLYAHMSKRLVSVGQTVKQGQVLGITGNTGMSKGAHLHFEVTENGHRVDPLNYLTGYQKSW